VKFGIGQPLKRYEDQRLLTGRGRYTDDITLPGMAVGAVLRFAVSVSTSGFNIHTVGVILMVVGGIGLLISLFYATLWADRRREAAVVREPVAREYVDRV